MRPVLSSSALVVLSALLIACGGPSEPAAPAAPAAKEAPAAAEAEAPASGKPAETPPNEETPAAEGVDPAAFRPVDIEGAAVHFVEPSDGATVTSPLKVVFGAKNVEIVPAGELRSNTGHHHLILDAEPPAAGETVPADATHIHYGKGQTETTVELAPGKHTLTMQLADGLHRSYGAPLRASITVTVAAAE